MQVQGRIAQSSEGTFEGWDLTQEIPELDVYDVRYSRGFLRAPFDAWFGDVRADWQPLAERLGIELENFSLRRGFVFPENVGRVVPVEFGGEIGVIGLEDASANALLRVFGSGVDESAEDLLLEYLERRLLSTLSAVWRSDTQFTTSYLAPDEVESVEIVGVLTVHCTFGGNPLSVHFGLGPRMLEFFDLRHRREFVASQLLDSDALDSETVELSVELVELNVEPAMLVDYMRSGTAISLDLPRSHSVYVSADGKPWARGSLAQFNGRFSVILEEFGEEPAVRNAATTRVSVEIAHAELDPQSFIELQQPGAVLMTATPIGNAAGMIISGERVATAMVGQIGDILALNILPK